MQLPGFASVFATVAMDISLIRRLVVTHLQPFDRGSACLQLFAPAGAVAAEAAAMSGVGLDLHSGERVLASLLVRRPSRIAVAITNHRIIVGGAGTGFAMRHDEVTKAHVEGASLELDTASGRRDLSALFAHCESLEGFFRALAASDLMARVEPPCPTFAPGGSDPTGGQGALATLWANDPDAAEMLGAIVRRERSGDLEVGYGQDLVGRVVLAHRARANGPAAFGPNYLSPLRADDFGELLLALFGAPVDQRTPNPGINRLDFRVDKTTVGIAYREVSGGTCFQLLTTTAPRLETADPALAHRVHQRLIAGAYARLERMAVGVDLVPEPTRVAI